MRTLIVVAVVSAALVVLPARAIAGDELTYSGSSTIVASIFEAGALRAFDGRTGLRFKSVEQPGSGREVDALLSGKVLIAGISRTMKPEEKDRQLLATAIGYDAMAVFVHRNNPVKSLTKDQLKGIYTGRIRNWSEVGGKNAPIQPNIEIAREKRVTTLAFQEMAMDMAPYGTGFKEIDFPRNQLVDVARNENAICSVRFGLLAAVARNLQGNLKAIPVNAVAPTDENIRSGAYPVSRPLSLVTKGMPTGNAKKFIDFMLSSEGQKVVAQNFVPVRK